MGSEDPSVRLRRIYRELDGFLIPPGDVRTVERSRGSATYGELMPSASLRLLAQLDLRRHDVFYDLGAGIGKLVLLAAMTTPVGRACGVELSPQRAALGQQAFGRARASRVPGARRASLIQADMLRCPLADATVVYTCSTAFSSTFMARLVRRLARLPNLRTLVSLRELDEHPAFEQVAAPRLDASWKRRTKVHIYARKHARKHARKPACKQVREPARPPASLSWPC